MSSASPSQWEATEPFGSFTANLERFIAAAREKKAFPVLKLDKEKITLSHPVTDGGKPAFVKKAFCAPAIFSMILYPDFSMRIMLQL